SCWASTPDERVTKRRSAIRSAATWTCTATPVPSSKDSSRRPWSASSKSSRVEVSADTRLLVVLGDPVAHSLSPVMHNAAIRALGLDAVYVALATPAAALPGLLSVLPALGGAGNVTVPHKEATERCLARRGTGAGLQRLGTQRRRPRRAGTRRAPARRRDQRHAPGPQGNGPAAARPRSGRGGTPRRRTRSGVRARWHTLGAHAACRG